MAVKPRETRNVPDNERAIEEILADVATAMRERALGFKYGEFVLKVNFSAGKITMHRCLDEKIAKHGD